MTPIDIVNNFLGEELTVEVANRLSTGPENNVVELIQDIAPYYYDWLEKAEANPTIEEEQNCFCIDPFNRDLDWQQQIDIYKKHLLYFPRFTIPDPLASFLWAPITMAQLFGTISYDDKFKQGFKEALTLLAELAPSVKSNDINLMPLSFAADYNSVQERTRKELDFISTHEQGSYYNSLSTLAENKSTSEEGIKMVVGNVKLHGQLCSRLDLTPIAGNKLVHEIIKQDFKNLEKLLSTNQTHRVAETMFSYHVPGIEKASISRIIELRNNEDAFNEWRRNFGKIMDKVYCEQPSNEMQFEKELKEAADDILKPRLSEIKKAMSSSALEKILVPASLTIGAATSAFYIAGLPSFPITSVATASVTPIGWLIDKLIKRFNKSGRKATILREFYGYLT